MGTEAAFRTFITGNFFVADPLSLSNTDSLLDQGIIDSTGVLELIGFIEQEFGVTVDDQDLIPENLDSIACLAAYVDRKRSAAGLPASD
jgi:acyl carrier protein